MKHTVKPLIYMAGRMGSSIDNKQPGGENSCWRLFDVSRIKKNIALDIQDGDSTAGTLVPEVELRQFYGTKIRFLYSGPWKAMGSYHGYIHGITSPYWENVADKTFNASLQSISRSDVFIAYFDDLEAYGTLVELGFARALHKRIIVVTAYPNSTGSGVECNKLIDNIWFAITSADKHIEIPIDKAPTKLEQWQLAHKEIAKIISEWFPETTV